jgi:hypothetical protein
MLGRGIRSESAMDALCRTRLSLQALRGVFENVSGVVPTTVIFLSGGLVVPPIEGVARMAVSSGECEIRRED